MPSVFSGGDEHSEIEGSPLDFAWLDLPATIDPIALRYMFAANFVESFTRARARQELIQRVVDDTNTNSIQRAYGVPPGAPTSRADVEAAAGDSVRLLWHPDGAWQVHDTDERFDIVVVDRRRKQPESWGRRLSHVARRTPFDYDERIEVPGGGNIQVHIGATECFQAAIRLEA